MIAHPPCTHLAVSGARWFKEKAHEQLLALEFVRTLLDAPIRAYRAGEPGKHHQQPDSQARSDHPALAIRARRDQGDVPLAEEPAEAHADERSRGREGKVWKMPPSPDRWKSAAAPTKASPRRWPSSGDRCKRRSPRDPQFFHEGGFSMSTGYLHLHLKGEYFEAIKAGTKMEEYRLRTPYWRKRIANRVYDGIRLLKGYPMLSNPHTKLTRPWRGYTIKTITHPQFGPDPVEVYAITVNPPADIAGD
jgi:hypothetical protein